MPHILQDKGDKTSDSPTYLGVGGGGGRVGVYFDRCTAVSSSPNPSRVYTEKVLCSLLVAVLHFIWQCLFSVLEICLQRKSFDVAKEERFVTMKV